MNKNKTFQTMKIPGNRSISSLAVLANIFMENIYDLSIEEE